MPDREFILEVLLKAKDDTARAFASAVAGMKGYQTALEAQADKLNRVSEANDRYKKSIGGNKNIERDTKLALEDLNKEYDKLGIKTEEQAKALRQLEQAQERYTRAVHDGKMGTAEMVEVVAERAAAEKKLSEALQKNYAEGDKAGKTASDNAAKRARQQIEMASNAMEATRALAEVEKKQEVERKKAHDKELDRTRQQIQINNQLEARRVAGVKAREKVEKEAATKRAAMERQAEADAKRRIQTQMDLTRRAAAERAQTEKLVADTAKALNDEVESERLRRGKAVDSELDRIAREDAARLAQTRRESDELFGSGVRGISQQSTILARPNLSQTQEIQATRELARAQDELVQSGMSVEEVQRRTHTMRQQALRDYGFENQAALDAVRAEHGYADAVRMVEAAKREEARLTRAGARAPEDVVRVAGTKIHDPLPPTPDTGSQGGGGGILGTIADVKSKFADLDTSVSGFTGSFKNAFGFAAVALIQPLAVLIVGLVGAMAALASAAIAAGAALGTVFLSAVAEGIPIIGVFGAALERLLKIFQFVQAQRQALQQAFVQRATVAHQQAIGINQVAIAEHQYSNALYAVGQAQIAVGVAQFNLTQTRQQAARQLQDLIFQETNAKLAAEGASKSVVDAQKALRAAIATGGDVAGAQLQLSQAQANHAQSTAQAQRAITDAGRGSIARQSIDQQVAQAQRAISQAQRAVIDAQFAAKQAQAGITVAKEAAAGYNAGTAAQLSWLRSQLSGTELQLAKIVSKIFALFVGAHSQVRKLTDEILSAFIPLGNRIYQILTDPRFFKAMMDLATAIHDSIGAFFRTFTSNSAMKAFVGLIEQAARNVGPFAKIITNLFEGFGGIVKAAEPFVSRFLGFMVRGTHEFASFTNSTKGKNWLKDFFDIAFKSLEAFMRLASSLGRFIFDVITGGGGAKAGIGLLDDFRRNIDRLSTQIEKHGREWKTLHAIFASAKPALSALGEIFGAIGHGLIQLSSGKSGRSELKGIADLIAHVIIPALVQFAINIGKVGLAITNFTKSHPAFMSMLKNMIALLLTISFAQRGIGLLFGPLAAVVGVIQGIVAAFIAMGAAASLAIAGILTVIGIIVGVAAATGNLKELGRAALSPFITIWDQVRGPLANLKKAIIDLGNTVGIHLGNNGAHKVVKALIDIFAFFARVSATIIGEPFHILLLLVTNVLTSIKDALKGVKDFFVGVFHVIHGVLTLNGPEIVKGFKKIGKSILEALKSAFFDIPKLLVQVFVDMVKAVLKFLGISSPSKKFLQIGKDIVNGLKNALEAIPHLFIHMFQLALDWIAGVPHKLLKLAENIGISIKNGIWNGLKGLGGAVVGVFKTAINDGVIAPLNAVIGFLNSIKIHIPKIGVGPLSVGGGTIGFPHIDKIGKLARGGPIAGYGGGDRHPALLEGGEHVWAKEEVRAAGGHSAMFAMRSIYGKGGQGSDGRYAVGGAVSSAKSGPVVSVNVDDQGKTTQGVTGALGGELGNIQNFSKKFQENWTLMWQSLFDITKNAITKQETQFTGLLNKVTQIWKTLNGNSQKALDTLYNNFKDTLTKIDTDIFNAFWYIANAANKSLKAFNAKPVDITLGQIPKFASGGFVGNAGERGKDAVHAVLGRGEAVLNWAHQKVVDPALRKMYGFGLEAMFKRTRGDHAEGASPGGYAAGGYIYPFGSGLSLGRTDQGLDMTGSGFIGTIGKARFTRVDPQNSGTGWPGALGHGMGAMIVYQLLDGLAKGRYVYLAENVDPTNGVHVGSVLPAGSPYAHARGFYPYLEEGWASDGRGTTAAAYHAANYPNHSNTPEGLAFVQFLQGVAHGKISGGILGPTGAAPVVNQIKEVAVHGSGVLATLAKAAIHKITGAANKFVNDKAGAASTTGGFSFSGASPVGNIMKLSQVAAKAAGVPFDVNIVKELLAKESSGGQNLPPHNYGGSLDPAGPYQVISSTFAAYDSPGHMNRMNPFDNALAAFRYIKSRYGTLQNLAATTGLFGGAYKGYKGGGFVGDAVPILAHAGEWVMNKGQQLGLAGRLGTTVGNLKNSLGFTGGPDSFAGGGVVGGTATANSWPGVNDAKGLAVGMQALEKVLKKLVHTLENPPNLGQGTYTSTGVYKPPSIPVDDPAYYFGALQIYNKAQKITLGQIGQLSKKLSASKREKELGKILDQFLANFNQVAGDNGLFALATQAIADYTTQQQTVVELAAAGFKLVHNKLKHRRIQTPVQSARSDLNSTERILSDNESLQRQEVKALDSVNKQIKKLGPNAALDNTKKYQQLMADRQAMLNKLRETDSTIAQTIADRYQKTAALFQAQVDKVLRHPTLRLNIAQLASTIANALGDPNAILKADKGLVSAYKDQYTVLEAELAIARKKAKKDPRWKKVVDDLTGQIQNVAGQLVQAQIQALQDAISAIDTRAQIQSSITDFRNRMAAVIAGFGGQFQAAASQIQISQSHATDLTGQVGQYQIALAAARTQGNVQVITDLTQKIIDLTAQIAEANLQTQQLITAYRQLAVSIYNTQTQATSGFFSAAQWIATTLGAIAGNQNLVALIKYAKEAGIAIVNQGKQAVQLIVDTTSDPKKPFSNNQTEASGLLQQLTTAFKGGPQVFADTLAKLGPTLGAFEAKLPADQLTLFQSLVQSLIDNTTSQVENTQQLQLLNATTNQQQFTSSAWTMFREAIFNGMGGLLPQYAMAVPSMDVGGSIRSSGLLYGHKGEEITPASVVRTRGPSGGNNYRDVNVHVTNPTEVADPVHLGNAIGWRLAHDPNSR